MIKKQELVNELQAYILHSLKQQEQLEAQQRLIDHMNKSLDFMYRALDIAHGMMQLTLPETSQQFMEAE